MEYQLTKNQQQLFNIVEGTNDNCLILGKPGVGKSVLIRALTELGNKFYHLAAPTGLAALNIDGRTLHSLLRIPVSAGIFQPDFNQFTADEKTVNNIRYNVKHLIIDEISMVRADTFDYIDRLLREIKGVALPFGGIQIIAVGDFFQLPPVTRTEDRVQLTKFNYESPFAFDAHCFKGNFRPLVLSEVLRQKGDNKFIKLLDSARAGRVNHKEIELLNKQIGHPGDLRINLSATNNIADNINGGKLRAIPGDSTTFTGIKFGDWPALPVDEELNLKIGAQVMVKKNGSDRPPRHKGDFASKVVNGTIGIVVDIVKDDEEGDDHVVIETEKKVQHTIYIKRWEKKIKEKNSDGHWEERLVASYEQMPLILAWAISMHKSQGQSFDKVHIDPSRVFIAGQMYVALSRGRNIAGLSFQSEVTPGIFWADMDVLNFFNELEEGVKV